VRLERVQDRFQSLVHDGLHDAILILVVGILICKASGRREKAKYSAFGLVGLEASSRPGPCRGPVSCRRIAGPSGSEMSLGQGKSASQREVDSIYGQF
jgi:hypothetical protein